MEADPTIKEGGGRRPESKAQPKSLTGRVGAAFRAGAAQSDDRVLANLASTVSPKSDFAVIIHLFYPEMWTTTFSPLLERLTDKSFDLFITSPNDLKDTEREIILAYPEAYIVKLSNRGRDVLPFTNIAGILHSHGYSYFLKLHSKKSPQRIDGSEWLESMLDKLVPVNAALQEKLTDILRKDTTGLVGPSGHYVSLPVGKQSEIENRPRMNEVMHRTLTDRFELYAKVPWSDLGFFEGTMFWGRFDAIGGLVEANRNPIYYDAEAGQTDGTTAHAMERAFSVYPEIETKHMYEIGPDDVYRIQYRTDQYPDWSEYYKGKRRKVTR